MNVLEQEALEALRAVGVARTPLPGAVERAWDAMERRLVDGPPPLDIGHRPGALGRSPRRLVAIFATVAAILVVVGLASWSGAWLAGRNEGGADQAPYIAEPSAPIAPAPEPVMTPTLPPTVAPQPSATLDEAARSASPSPSPRRRAEPKRRAEPRAVAEPLRKEPAAAESTLAAELRLLSRANAAMKAGRHAEALDILAQHSREFEAGQLVPEREYKRALVLCELGRVDEARAVAAAFEREHAESPLRAKARDVCREGAR